MRALRHVALAALFAIALPAISADATSIVASPPHDPRRACAAILRLMGNLNAGRVRDEARLFGPNFYTDALGKVERDEEAAFLHAMRNSEGHPDDGPIRLYNVYRVHRARYEAIYLVVLERRSWHEIRLEEDSMLNVEQIRDPRYYNDSSFWLASFQSNDLMDFREATELFRMMGEAPQLRNCDSR